MDDGSGHPDGGGRMKVPLNWLREYCDPALDAREIEERLTMTGTKVEAIHHHGVDAWTTSWSAACSQRRAPPGRRPPVGVRGGAR